MKITHLQNACELIRCGDTRLLVDPWMTQGEYYGSWFHYPPCPIAPEDIDVDFIHVTHIHPDHLSRKTFERLPKRPVVIHEFAEKFLKRNIEALGFDVIEVLHGEPLRLGDATIEVYAADDCNPEICGRHFGCLPGAKKPTQIDTLSVISGGGCVILNTNDCPYSLATAAIDRVLAKHKKIDLLMVGYAGAGPYPQCFAFSDSTALRAMADAKCKSFIQSGVDTIKHVAPDRFMAFAGTYLLGGRLSHLNKSRGVPGIAFASGEMERATGVRAVMIDPGETFDVSDGRQTKPYAGPRPEEVAAFIRSTGNEPFDHDCDTRTTNYDLTRLATMAVMRFQKTASKTGYSSQTSVVVKDDDGFGFTFGVERPFTLGSKPGERFVEITVDRTLLARLLKGPAHAHWNTAEVGSHLRFRRDPDVYERGLFNCLSSLYA